MLSAVLSVLWKCHLFLVGPVEVLPTLVGPVEVLPILVGPVEMLPTLAGPVEVLPTLVGPVEALPIFGRSCRSVTSLVGWLGRPLGRSPGEVAGKASGETLGSSSRTPWASRNAVFYHEIEPRGSHARTRPETSPALINLPTPKGKATALGHASRAQGTVADTLL